MGCSAQYFYEKIYVSYRIQKVSFLILFSLFVLHQRLHLNPTFVKVELQFLDYYIRFIF